MRVMSVVCTNRKFVANFCAIVSLCILLWTLHDLKNHLHLELPLWLSLSVHPSKALPQLDSYPPEIREAILYAYNTSYQQLETIKNVKQRAPLIPGKMHTRLVLVSTWRSGSSFTTEMLVSHPGAYYQAEPLHILGIRRVFSENDVNKTDAYEIVRNILKCNNAPFKERAPADHWPHIYWFRHEQNHLYHPKCTDREFLKRREFCGNPKYLDGICTALPIQVTKLDRINLKFMVPLLTDEEIGSRTKILYLVRDPRAVYLSRKDFPWCVASPECIEPKYLCRDMVQDFHEAQKAAKWSPDQFMAVRHEDLVDNMMKKSEDIFNFMDLDMQDVTREFIEKATHPEPGQDEIPHNVHVRDPKTVTIQWRNKLKMPEITKIQDACKEAMELWGYNPIKNLKEKKDMYVKNFKIV